MLTILRGSNFPRGVAVAALLCVVLGACQAAPRDLNALWTTLQTEVGTPSCTSDAQCRTLAVGSKSCGGPASYLAWSTAVSDATRLEALARDHAEAQKADNASSGRVSNCMLVSDPGASCGPQGVCVLRARGTGTGAGAVQ